MEEQPQPWDERELRLPNPEDKVQNIESDTQTVADQKISEKRFAEEAVEEALKQSPEFALQRIMKAADKDKPLEGELERRHEVRDEHTSPSHGAVPVGNVIASTPDRHPGLATASPPPVEPPLPAAAIPAQGTAQTKPYLYRRAIYAGFFGAVTLIIIFAIFLLLRD